MTHVNIFEPDLTTKVGHHFGFSYAIARELINKGCSVHIYANANVQAAVSNEFSALGCRLEALFSNFVPMVKEGGLSVNAAVEVLTQELARAPRADLALFPTLMSEHFRAFTGLDKPDRMVGLVHYDPDRFHEAGGRLWSEASERVQRNGMAVRIGAIDPLIGDYMQTFSMGMPVLNFPVPIGTLPKADHPAVAKTVGFFGHQREERGIGLMPDLIKSLLNSGVQVLLHDTLRQFKVVSRVSGLEIIDGFVADLPTLMKRCDVIICLMQKEKYALRVSGIVFNAVASGVPFVLPSGTLPAMRFDPQGCCSCYQEHSLAGVLAAISRIRANYGRYVHAARRAASMWNESNGVDRFVSAAMDRW